jgi:hypothetical protein
MEPTLICQTAPVKDSDSAFDYSPTLPNYDANTALPLCALPHGDRSAPLAVQNSGDGRTTVWAEFVEGSLARPGSRQAWIKYGREAASFCVGPGSGLRRSTGQFVRMCRNSVHPIALLCPF